MRAVVQRVARASVEIDGRPPAEITQGLMVLLGVGEQDGEEQCEFLAKKLVNLRIFSDSEDKMNLSLLDIGGELLVVSNFTLYANCKKGNRPSFVSAGAPALAVPLYESFVCRCQEHGVQNVQTGEFGADMQVHIQNDGPVTIILDTDEIMPKKQ